MIEWMSNWAEQIIVAVIIAGIIEMILPNGNNKKYIKAVIGVYILFTVISPVISKFAKLDIKDIDYEKYFKQTDTYQTMSSALTTNNDKSVTDIYINNLKQDMKNKIQEQGYAVENININVVSNDEEDYGRIQNINLSLYKKEEKEEENNITNTMEVGKIEKINIGKENQDKEAKTSVNDKLSTSEKNEIKAYLSSVYDVKKKNIKVNE